MTLEEAKSRLMTCITDCGDCFCCADHDTAVSVVLEELANRESGWISVDDRLPDSGVMVLVLANGKPNKNVTLVNAYELAEYDQDGWILDTWPEWMDADVTHWMPLPEPPKEVEHETNCSF